MAAGVELPELCLWGGGVKAARYSNRRMTSCCLHAQKQLSRRPAAALCLAFLHAPPNPKPSSGVNLAASLQGRLPCSHKFKPGRVKRSLWGFKALKPASAGARCIQRAQEPLTAHPKASTPPPPPPTSMPYEYTSPGLPICWCSSISGGMCVGVPAGRQCGAAAAPQGARYEAMNSPKLPNKLAATLDTLTEWLFRAGLPTQPLDHPRPHPQAHPPWSSDKCVV
jgi:hypothetical protein